MDLDTNVKKFSYSPVAKIICILLSFICFASSAYLVLGGICAIDIRNNRPTEGKRAPVSWTETGAFYHVINISASDIIWQATQNQREANFKKSILEQKASIVELAIKKNLELFENAPSFDEYQKQYYSDDDLLEIYKNEFFGENIIVNVSFDDCVRSFDEAPLISNDVTKLKEYFDEKYDSFAENKIQDYNDGYYPDIKLGADYYCEYAGTVLSSTEANNKFSEADAKKSDYYIILKDGKLAESKGVPEDVAKLIATSHSESQYEKQTYLCIYFNDIDIAVSGLVNLFDGKSNLALIKYTFNNTQNIYDHIEPLAVLCVLMLVISFVTAFTYFTCTGRSSKDEKARLLFTDYVFVEIQAAIIGLAGFGLGVLGCVLTEGIYTYAYNIVYLYTTLAVAILCWVMLFCLCSSVGRYIHSDKKFHKHLLTYWVLFAVYMVLKFIFKGNVKFFRWLFGRIKKSAKRTKYAFAYKPTKFKRNMIALTCLYFAGNVLVIILDAISFATEAPVFFILLTLILIAGNFVVMRKAAAYIRSLDTIIAASEKHEDTGLITEILDPSLQILNESMRYTNAELQQAIAKAVKDERLRTELITNVSHDLKTPLTSIINYVDLLTKCDIEDERAKEYLAVLTEKSDRLKRLIEDLIEASKLSSGNITVNLAPLNLSELCLQSTVDVQRDFENAGLSLVVKQGEKPEIVIADGPKTYRVLENLFSNAKKYSAKASRVYVSVFSDDTHGIIEIKNISAKPLDISAEELTERFVRGDSSRNQEGNGLGLSIATELCKAMNGELEIIIDGDLFKARVKLPNK